jgi:hypothetical protein
MNHALTTHSDPRWARAAAAPVILCWAFTSCIPLPIAHTIAHSAPVVGVLERNDGTPISGTTVSVVYEAWETTCARPRVQAATSVEGVFELQETVQRYGWTWIGLFHVYPPNYLLCFDTEAGPRPGYIGLGALGVSAPADSLSCVEWPWSGSVRISCMGRQMRGIVTGGAWSDSVATGTFRVFVTEEPKEVSGYDRPQPRPLLHVQWLEDAGRGPPYVVRDTTTIDVGDRARDVWDGFIAGGAGESILSFSARVPRWWNDMRQGSVVIRLGRPGEPPIVAVD